MLAEFLTEYHKRYALLVPRGALAVPVPLHPRRERVRGFNQAALIAEEFAARNGLEYRGTVLSRLRNTASQVTLSLEQRKKNMEGAFLVREPSAVKGRRVMLFDDVATSGATLEEAARVLKAAGAKKIWAVTVAH